MASCKPYILELIRSVKGKPAIWDSKSEFNHMEKHVRLHWELVVAELQMTLNNNLITVSDVIHTWSNLLQTYNACLGVGNYRSFKYFGAMCFVNQSAAWERRTTKHYAKDSNPAHMLNKHRRICELVSVLFLCLLVHELTSPVWEVPIYLCHRILITIPPLFLWAIIIPISKNNKIATYDPDLIRSELVFLAVPMLALVLEKVFLSNLESSTVEVNSSLALFVLGFPVILSFFSLNAGQSVERPFPPSKDHAFWRFSFSLGWAYNLCVIYEIIKANSIFYVVPVLLILNAIFFAWFCNYLWINVTTIFPKFNMIPFEAIANPTNPYRIKFEQKTKNQTIDGII